MNHRHSESFRFVRNCSGKWPRISQVLEMDHHQSVVVFEGGIPQRWFCFSMMEWLVVVWCPKEIKQKQQVLRHDHLSVVILGNEFWVFFRCMMSHILYLLFLPGYLPREFLASPSGPKKCWRGGKFLCQRQAAGWNQKVAANWDPQVMLTVGTSELHIGDSMTGLQGVNHPRLIWQMVGLLYKPCRCAAETFFFVV